jgi:hypothetical protein
LLPDIPLKYTYAARRRIRVRPPFVSEVAITRKYFESALL